MKKTINQQVKEIYSEEDIDILYKTLMNHLRERTGDWTDVYPSLLACKHRSSQASYILARAFAGAYDKHNNLLPIMDLSEAQREKMALELTKEAIHQGNDSACRFLIAALLSGFGCIRPNSKQLYMFFENAEGEHIQYSLGCYLLGYYPNGSHISPSDNLVQANLEFDSTKGLNLLKSALGGTNYKFICKSIDIMFQYYRDRYEITNARYNVSNQILLTANQKSHQFLFLLLSLLYAPQDLYNAVCRAIPEDIELPECMNSLRESLLFSNTDMNTLLAKALDGKDEIVKCLAMLIYNFSLSLKQEVDTPKVKL